MRMTPTPTDDQRRGEQQPAGEHPQGQHGLGGPLLDRARTPPAAGRRRRTPRRSAASSHSHAFPPSSSARISRLIAVGEQQAARPVDPVPRALDRLVEVPDQQPRRGQAQRDVDEEDPVPGQELGEQPAERRTDHRRDAPHARDVALRLGPLGDRVDVPGDRDGHRLHGPGAEPLDRAERDQRRHAPREPAQHRARAGTARCRAGSPACGRRCRPAWSRSARSRPASAGRPRTATGSW